MPEVWTNDDARVLRAFGEAGILPEHEQVEHDEQLRTEQLMAERRRRTLDLLYVVILFTVGVGSYAAGLNAQHQLAIDAYDTAAYHRALTARLLTSSERALAVCTATDAVVAEAIEYSELLTGPTP